MRVSATEIFYKHIEELLAGERTYKQLSIRLGVSESCLKSWLIKQRSPSIRSIDKVANRIGCHTYQLIRQEPLVFSKRIQNDSHTALCRNLSLIFIEHHCFTIPQKLSLLNHQISDFALASYLRTNNYKLPTLKKLDEIACVLGVKTHLLLFEED